MLPPRSFYSRIYRQRQEGCLASPKLMSRVGQKDEANTEEMMRASTFKKGFAQPNSIGAEVGVAVCPIQV